VSRLQSAIAELRDQLGDRCTTNAAILEHHSRDESMLPPMAPDAVVYPLSTPDVSAIVAACSRHRVPVIPFGAGTSLEGHVLATSGGVCVDMTRMNRILSLRADDLNVTVQAGVTRKQLESHLGQDGMFFPVDPGADATIGGMVGTGASGTTAVKYGTMRANVLALEVVLPSATVIRVGTHASKSAAGYDLTRLIIGSEGTLGIVTEATLRVFGIPETVAAAVVQFDELEAAVRVVVQCLQIGVDFQRIELLDPTAIRAINAHASLGLMERPTLFAEFGGPEGAVAAALSEFRGQCEDASPAAIDVGIGRQARDRLWTARHNAYFASLALRPGSRALTTDVCVPLSSLASCIVETDADLRDLPFPSTIVGHVGDGNFHALMLIDPTNATEVELGHNANDRIVARALAAGGTCTGEHGIGIGKRQFLRQEAGDALEVMASIKQALDPLGIMNPGKVV
jgi:D-lactate dehydrogenase (cytochrome)